MGTTGVQLGIEGVNDLCIAIDGSESVLPVGLVL